MSHAWHRALLAAALVFAGVMGMPGGVAAADLRLNQFELKLGVIAPLTGPVPDFGQFIRDGVLLAVQEWNARGGILGERITTIVEDGQCSPGPAVAAAHKLIETDGVHFIIGEVCSKASIPVSEIANAARVIQVSPTSTNLGVTVDATGAVKRFVFRNCFVDPFQGIVGARFAYGSLRARTAFVMADSANDYVSGLAGTFTAEFTRLGGTIVGTSDYDGERKTDFSSEIAQVRTAAPDVVYLPDYYNVVNLVARQARAGGITVPFIGGDGWDSSDLDARAADGSYFTNHFSDDDPRPEVATFLEAFDAAYPGPNYSSSRHMLAALAYDAANMIFTAIQDAGTEDTAQVGRALEAIRFHGVTGDLAYDAVHNPQKSAYVFAVKDGAVRFVERVDP